MGEWNGCLDQNDEQVCHSGKGRCIHTVKGEGERYCIVELSGQGHHDYRTGDSWCNCKELVFG